LGCCSVRLAPNVCVVAITKRWVSFERSCEPRGRGSLRPRRARPPFTDQFRHFCGARRSDAPYLAREPSRTELLEEQIVRLLGERKQTLALAESCTGGYIAHRITNVPGASAIFSAGLVTYSNEAKQRFLGVRAETLARHGAVSESVAREMAEG